MKETYYFAYGSNMNLDQMAYRCPAASVVEPVHLPEEGSRVEGVLWKITPECEKSLDFYEGYPHLYGKEPVLVQGKDGMKREVMAYTMNAPYKDQPAIPSDLYFMGIVEGCHQNGISSRSVTDALKRVREEVGRQKPSQKKTEVSR